MICSAGPTSALGWLDEALEQTRARSVKLQADPTLCEGRRCMEHPASQTVGEIFDASGLPRARSPRRTRRRW